MNTAVFMANYEALDRCLYDQVVTDAVASRVGKVSELLHSMISLLYVHHFIGGYCG